MFDNDKKHTLEKLQNAVENGYVDPEIMYFVDQINELKNYYTTSSCIGRCGIIEFPKGKNPKIYSKWLGKWHHYAEYSEIDEAISKKSKDFEKISFVLNSPILHIASKDLNSSKALLDLAYNNGLKGTSIKAITGRRFIVEIITTVKLDAPVAYDGKMIVDFQYLKILLDEGNHKLKHARNSLKRLYDKLDELNR
ncbi:Protein of unknown function DUF207 [Methanococcus vannielii SB]|uniref:tRNA(Phe) 7-((3-amino-3-carboxypropyl)-4-demethylwyosine(37)-N(4))-methyltransferase n=1 Tax=Methanococcus vannielii (strain ATCC 35089 / DSM 1224 / JCM 13029 / OCM 148 / SB) TaxID=406327 RepID=A6URU6_METVS|nr:hypothetical protein [Methanococcus vannielii]ABR55218.1 Protein of unknown function DUF207 [Methanococcus vannielii SB]